MHKPQVTSHRSQITCHKLATMLALLLVANNPNWLYSQTSDAITHGSYIIYQNPVSYYVSPAGNWDVWSNALPIPHTLNHIRVELFHRDAQDVYTSIGFVSDPCPVVNKPPPNRTWTAGVMGPLPSTPAGQSLRCRATLYYNIGGNVFTIDSVKTLASVP